jgi:hypothetical protein
LVNQISLIWRALDYVGDDKWMTSYLTDSQFRGLHSTRHAFEVSLTIRSGICSAIDQDECSVAIDEFDHSDEMKHALAISLLSGFPSSFRALFHAGATRLCADDREKDAGRDPSNGGAAAKSRDHRPPPAEERTVCA